MTRGPELRGLFVYTNLDNFGIVDFVQPKCICGVEMKSWIFSIVIEDDAFEDGRKASHAYCPALKGCHTWGHTYDEALTNIQEAVSLYIEDLLEAGS